MCVCVSDIKVLHKITFLVVVVQGRTSHLRSTTLPLSKFNFYEKLPIASELLF